MGEEESGVVFESPLKLTLRDLSGCQLRQVDIPPLWVHRATQVSPEAEFSDQFSAILTGTKPPQKDRQLFEDNLDACTT